MNIDEFQEWMLSHWENPKPQSNSLLYLSNAFCGEAGELANVVKKIVRDRDSIPSQEDIDKLILESGDCLHYLLRIFQVVGFPLEEVLDKNYEKLIERYKDRGSEST